MKDESGAPRILLAVLLSGVLVGVMGALFVGALGLANTARAELIAAAEGLSIPGWLAGVLAGLTGA